MPANTECGVLNFTMKKKVLGRLLQTAVGPALLLLASAPVHAGEGGLWEQRSLLDTPGGMKETFRDAGINLDVWLTSTLQSVVAGDGDKDWKLGHKGDLIATFDAAKMGLWPGLNVVVHHEVNWGNDVNSQGDGSILPLSTAMGFPRLSGADHETSIYAIQTIGSNATLIFGKINMLDLASQTPIAGGGGWETFMATGLAAPISGVTPPYLLGGIALLNTKHASFTAMLYDPRNAADTDVLAHPFENGVTASLAVTIPTKLSGYSGSYGVRGVYSSQEGLDLGSIAEVVLPPGSADIQNKQGYWYVGVSAQQYLWQDPDNPTVGWGLFGQAAISDGNPNPFAWSVLGGIGGTGGIFEGRDLDRWGIGYFRYGLSEDLKDGLAAIGSGIEDEQGIEAYYNYAVAPWWRVTADLQWIDPATPGLANAVAVAIRTQVKF